MEVFVSAFRTGRDFDVCRDGLVLDGVRSRKQTYNSETPRAISNALDDNDCFLTGCRGPIILKRH